MSEQRADRKKNLAPTIENRRARHEYFIEETIEAGIVLVGSEIKSVRAGRVNLTEGYIRVEKGEAWLLNTHISPWQQAGTYFNHEPTRPRKLLLHIEEIARLKSKVSQKGLTLVPLKLYFVRGRAKLEIGVAKGKKLYDKREAIGERDAQRDMERQLRERNRRTTDDGR
jgi:SsrA-binding protein